MLLASRSKMPDGVDPPAAIASALCAYLRAQGVASVRNQIMVAALLRVGRAGEAISESARQLRLQVESETAVDSAEWPGRGVPGRIVNALDMAYLDTSDSAVLSDFTQLQIVAVRKADVVKATGVGGDAADTDSPSALGDTDSAYVYAQVTNQPVRNEHNVTLLVLDARLHNRDGTLVAGSDSFACTSASVAVFRASGPAHQRAADA